MMWPSRLAPHDPVAPPTLPECHICAADLQHHYSTQSHEAMRRKQRQGSSSTFNRKSDQSAWAYIEWAANLQRDPALRDNPQRASCHPATNQPPPRPLERNGSGFSWDTWSALPWRVSRDSATVTNLQLARLVSARGTSKGNKSGFVAEIFRAITSEETERADVGGHTAAPALAASPLLAIGNAPHDAAGTPREDDESDDERTSASAGGAAPAGESPAVRKKREGLVRWRWDTYLCQLAKSGLLTTRPYRDYVPRDDCCGCLEMRLRACFRSPGNCTNPMSVTG